MVDQCKHALICCDEMSCFVIMPFWLHILWHYGDGIAFCFECVVDCSQSVLETMS